MPCGESSVQPRPRPKSVTFAARDAPCCTKPHACPQLARSLQHLSNIIVAARKRSERARNDGLGLSSTEATGAASSNTGQHHGQEHAPPPRAPRAPLPRRRRDHPRDGRGTSGVDRLRRLGRSWERLKESISSQRHLSDRLKECPASGLSSASGL